jgi:hypothetical protein
LPVLRRARHRRARGLRADRLDVGLARERVGVELPAGLQGVTGLAHQLVAHVLRELAEVDALLLQRDFHVLAERLRERRILRRVHRVLASLSFAPP